MQHVLPILLFAATIMIGYAPEWAPFYVNIFSPSSPVQHLGSISKFERPCSLEDRPSATCTHEYVIPPEALNLQADQSIALGVGTIISASEFYCGNSKTPFSTVDDPESPGRSFDVRNIYQVAFIDQSKCPSGITIRAWSQKGAKRRGHVGGALVVGPFPTVERIKAVAEFSNRDIRIVMALVVLFALIVNKILIQITGQTKHADEFERFHLAWFGYLAISSGLVQIAFPISEAGLFGKISSVFSFVAHVGPVLAVTINFLASSRFANAFKRIQSRPQSLVTWTFLVSCVLCFSPWYLVLFSPIGIVFSVLSIFVGARTSSIRLVCYGLALFLNCLKLVDVPYLPHAHLASLYAGIFLCESAVLRLRSTGRYLGVLTWIRLASRAFVVEEKLIELLLGIGKRLNVGRVTLIELHGKGECEISFAEQTHGQLKDSGIFTRQRIPAVSAHVVTTKQALWHIKEKSDLHRNIHRGASSPSHYRSPIFSVVPILGETDIVGIIAFTNYGQELAKDIAKHDELSATISLLEPYLAEVISKRQVARRLGVEEIQVRMLERLQKLEAMVDKGDVLSTKDVCSRFLTCFVPEYTSTAFIGKYDSSSGQIKVIAAAGYAETIAEKLRNGTIVVSSSNQHGPIPLAVSRNEVIIVSDIANVEHVIHPISLDLMQKNGAKSVAAVPLKIPSFNAPPRPQAEEAAGIWGVLWLEQTGSYAFSLKDHSILGQIQTSFSRLLQALDGRVRLERAEMAITESMPRRIAAKLLAGEEVEERERGYLLMIDLKESSKIASLTSGAWWELFVRDHAIPPLDEIAKKHGLVLQQVIWDAFYFTLTAPSESASDEAFMYSAAQDMANKIDELYEHHFQTLSGYSLPSGHKMRACLVYGDISRGFSNGPSKVWTIVGTAMAHVSKLEAACKQLDGLIFTVHTRSEKAPFDPILLPTGATLPMSGEKIYTVRIEQDDPEAAHSNAG